MVGLQEYYQKKELIDDIGDGKASQPLGFEKGDTYVSPDTESQALE